MAGREPDAGAPSLAASCPKGGKPAARLTSSADGKGVSGAGGGLGGSGNGDFEMARSSLGLPVAGSAGRFPRYGSRPEC